MDSPASLPESSRPRVSRSLVAVASRVSFAVLPAFGLLLAVLSQQQDAYHAGHGFSLLAALVAVGCAGHLAAHIHQRYGYLLSACSDLVGLLSAAFALGGDGPERGYESPSRPKIVFRSFFVLFSGLGGRVDAGPLCGPRARALNVALQRSAI